MAHERTPGYPGSALASTSRHGDDLNALGGKLAELVSSQGRRKEPHDLRERLAQIDPLPPARPGPGDDGVTRTRAYLQGGGVFASAQPTAVTTVLGSCIAVCLFAPSLRAGGMNHFLLPSGPGDGTGRFGKEAMQLLLARLLALGAGSGDLRAKVFGGAGTLGARPDSGGRTLGEQNAELAVQVLAREGIPVLGGDVGGARGRKLVFHTDTGDAWVLGL